MKTFESCLPNIDVIFPFAQSKIYNAYSNYLLYFRIRLSNSHIFCYGFGCSKKHSHKIIQFSRVLNLYNNMFALRIFSIQINSVKFVIFFLLVAFAFQKPFDFDILFQKFRKKAFEDVKIFFITQYFFGCPIETDMLLCHFSRI